MLSARRVTALLLMTAILLAGATAAEAGSIRITNKKLDDTLGPYANSSGGEFTGYDYDLSAFHPQSDLAHWDRDGDGIKDEFQTFCLEVNEDPFDKLPLTYTLSDTAVMGGKGFLGNGGAVDWDGTAAGDPLSYASAYLFDAFWRGYLADYDWTDTKVSGDGSLDGRADYAKALQYAIWYLENEITKAGVGTEFGVQVNKWIDLAIDEANLTNGGTWGATYGQVRVLSLVDEFGNKVQDRLVLVPLPGAAWAGLAMLGALGMFRTIRRRRQD